MRVSWDLRLLQVFWSWGGTGACLGRHQLCNSVVSDLVSPCRLRRCSQDSGTGKGASSPGQRQLMQPSRVGMQNSDRVGRPQASLPFLCRPTSALSVGNLSACHSSGSPSASGSWGCLSFCGYHLPPTASQQPRPRKTPFSSVVRAAMRENQTDLTGLVFQLWGCWDG